jgi:glyoxylase-like metal-dependent hydrolase (beta-lactamase superfamily II)
MLRIEQHGPITVFRMGRHVAANHRWVLYETHAFLIDETMIDTGTIAVRREWEPKLDGCRCSAIINTHHHEDHIGNNRLFQDRFGAEIYAHPGALAFLKEPRRIGLQLYRRVVWNLPDRSRGRPIGETVATSRHILHVFQTPGHCPDHICLYEPVNGWLFSGDIFCGKKVIYLRADEDFNQTLESLKRLAALDIRTLFCGLKGTVEEGGKAMKEKIRGMEELRDRALELHERGLSARDSRRRLLGHEDRMYCITGGHFSKQNVIDSLLGKG